jgi:hypothetical protein
VKLNNGEGEISPELSHERELSEEAGSGEEETQRMGEERKKGRRKKSDKGGLWVKNRVW